MKQKLNKKSLISNTLQVGGFHLLSKMLGIVREVLTVRYLGVSAAADAFITAWKIPNSLRKIFAEGALSAAFIPMLVKKVKDGKRVQVHSLITMGFLVFEGFVFALCILVMCNASSVVRLMAPGFSQQQVINAMPYLQILMPFILFISSSALLAGALESVNHFFVPAVSPILLNVIFIGALLVCLQYSLPVNYLCYFIVSAGFLQFVWHIITFFKLGFTFGPITKEARSSFLTIVSKFANCLLSMSVMELSLVIDTQFASMLSEGSIALLYYANRFMGIPLSVFVTAFSTILLPHLSHVVTYAPKRLSFYVLEATKFIFWITLPATLLMIFFAQDIFITIFLSDRFPIDKICIASQVLVAFMTGLFFFSLNRILLNVYYALDNTWIPAVVSFIGACANIALNWIFIDYLGVSGLAYATVLSAALQAILYFYYLSAFIHMRLYVAQFITFASCYLRQVVVIGGLFLVVYYSIQTCIIYMCSPMLAAVLLHTLMLWIWVGPLCCATFAVLYYLRSLFKVKVYFLEK